ncbi:hypothetical protein ACFVYG_20135 [Streptomyces sp. NPDC058256]|uniref:hypothetical protein n=1 Tax=Streptomyces sp. NPDC058256 TaxID=3346408 RepID=UPI0036F1834B
MGLPPALGTGEFEFSSETDQVWLLWKADLAGAILVLDRPQGEQREARDWLRCGRVRSLRSLLGRVLRRD